jgi:hypothetical protein
VPRVRATFLVAAFAPADSRVFDFCGNDNQSLATAMTMTGDMAALLNGKPNAVACVPHPVGCVERPEVAKKAAEQSATLELESSPATLT